MQSICCINFFLYCVETHAFEGEKSLSPSSKLKGIKSHFSVQAKEIFEVSDISDSTDAQGKGS